MNIQINMNVELSQILLHVFNSSLIILEETILKI